MLSDKASSGYIAEGNVSSTVGVVGSGVAEIGNLESGIVLTFY